MKNQIDNYLAYTQNFFTEFVQTSNYINLTTIINHDDASHVHKLNRVNPGEV